MQRVMPTIRFSALLVKGHPQPELSLSLGFSIALGLPMLYLRKL